MNEKKEKILLFAKKLVISEQRFNQATGKVEIVKHNTIDALNPIGSSCPVCQRGSSD